MAVFITERQVTIRLDVLDNIGNRLLEIQKQRDALMAKPNVAIRFDDPGLTKIKQNILQANAGMAAATQQGRSMGASLATALSNANAQFQRQRDLAKFWGTSGYMHQGLVAFKGNLGGFLSGAGQGFTGWLKGALGHLAQYKNAIIAAGAAVAGLAVAAGVGSLRSKNYVESVMSTSLMQRKLTNPEGAKSWIEQAQKTDWSAGRQERAGIFQSIMSRMPYVNQESGQRFTEDIEKTFAADIEMWKGKGVGSAQQLADLLSTEQLSGDQAKMLDDIYGLGFSNRTAQARMERVSFDAGKLNMDEEMKKRPDLVLANRLGKIKEGFGEAMIPAVVKLLGFIIKLTDAWAKFSKSNIGQALFAGIQKGLDWVLGIAEKIAGFIGKYFGAADKQFGKSGSYSDSIKAGLGAILGTSSPVYKSLGFVIDFLKKIWVLTDGGKKIFSFISTVLEKLWGVANWIYGVLKKIYDWLAEKIAWASGGLKDMLGVEKLDWTNLKPLLPTWENLFPKLPDWSGILDPLRSAINSFVTWLAETFPFLGINQQNVDDVLQGSNGAIRPKFTPEEMEKSKDPAHITEYVVYHQGRPMYYATAEEAAAAANTEWLNAQHTGSDTGSLPAGALQPGFGKLQIDKTGKPTVSTTQTTPGSGLTAEEQRQRELASAVTSQTAPLEFVELPQAAAGGKIRGTGALIGHGMPGAEEEIDPADVVKGGKTTLAKINDMISGAGSRMMGGIRISAPITVNVGRVDSSVDLEKALEKAGAEFDRKLIFRLRNSLDDTGFRGISYLRG